LARLRSRERQRRGLLGGTGWFSRCGTRDGILGKRSLKLLGSYTRRRPLLPSHLRSTFTVDLNELPLGRTSRELEQPDTLGASRTNFALGHRLLLRSGRLRRLGLYLVLHFRGGPHLSASCLTGYSCGLLNATDRGFFLPCPILLFRHCCSPV